MKASVLALIFAVFAAPAFAQDQQQPAQQSGHGMFKEACGADMDKFCSDAKGHDARMSCVMANKDKFSDSCKTFLANHQMHHGQSQMQGQSQQQ